MERITRNYGLNFMWIMPFASSIVISMGIIQWKQLTGLQKQNE